MRKTSVCDLIKEYPGQYIMFVPGQLCHETLSGKESTVQKHESKKHQNRVASIDKNKTESQTKVKMTPKARQT